MKTTVLVLTLAGTLVLAGCGKQDASGANSGQPAEAKKAAGDQTIAAGLPANSRFAALAKAAGLDKTLAGPGPYTVLVPSDAAFARLPAGTVDDWSRPEQRARLTSVLTYHILPGVVLAGDFATAIDNQKGKAPIATMGGATITATREGGKIVLTDSAGTKATLVKSDEARSNGVVHEIDAVLAPPKEGQNGASSDTSNGNQPPR